MGWRGKGSNWQENDECGTATPSIRVQRAGNRERYLKGQGTRIEDMARAISDEAESLLESEPLVAHLSTCHDGKPHVAPLWFNYRDGAIEITTTGRKLDNIKRNPRVALSVQKDDEGMPVWGMTIRGTATVIEDDETSQSVLHRINRRYGVEEDAFSENTPVRIDVGSVEHWQY